MTLQPPPQLSSTPKAPHKTRLEAAETCNFVPHLPICQTTCKLDNKSHTVCTACAASYVGCLVYPNGQIVALRVHCAERSP